MPLTEQLSPLTTSLINKHGDLAYFMGCSMLYVAKDDKFKKEVEKALEELEILGYDKYESNRK